MIHTMMVGISLVCLCLTVITGGALSVAIPSPLTGSSNEIDQPRVNSIHLKEEDWQPQQIHISYGASPDEMVIQWTTTDKPPATIVEYGVLGLGLTNVAEGQAALFRNAGFELRTEWMHRVHLTNLEPGTTYEYHCGSPAGWSSLFFFTALKNGTDWPVRLAVYGDMGAVNAQSLARLQEDTQRGMYDAIIHVGDFGYDMHDDEGRVGDKFMNEIESIAAYVPYMTCPGNHEKELDYFQYRNRFTMPDSEDMGNLFYSWDMGPIHFISIDTESYYYNDLYGDEPLMNQYEWLKSDLEEATKPSVRAERPWIILYGHRPMYCSTGSDWKDCLNINCKIRVGMYDTHDYALEPLLDQYGVDLAVWGHNHHYERLYPMYNYTVMNGTVFPYTNPLAPVHITTGSAGCEEDHSPFAPEQPDWSAFRSIDYGYSRLTVHNDTHLYWEQVSDDQQGEIVDSLWLVRENHLPYADVRLAES